MYMYIHCVYTCRSIYSVTEILTSLCLRLFLLYGYVPTIIYNRLPNKIFQLLLSAVVLCLHVGVSFSFHFSISNRAHHVFSSIHV